jgi:hypothetical protein
MLSWLVEVADNAFRPLPLLFVKPVPISFGIAGAELPLEGWTTLGSPV